MRTIVIYWNSQKLEYYYYINLRMNENMEFPGISGEDIQWLQDSFVQTIFTRLEVPYIFIEHISHASVIG